MFWVFALPIRFKSSNCIVWLESYLIFKINNSLFKCKNKHLSWCFFFLFKFHYMLYKVLHWVITSPCILLKHSLWVAKKIQGMINALPGYFNLRSHMKGNVEYKFKLMLTKWSDELFEVFNFFIIPTLQSSPDWSL